MTKLITEARKVKDGYKGFLGVYENGKRLYTLDAEIVRITSHDARLDALNMASELKALNHIS